MDEGGGIERLWKGDELEAADGGFGKVGDNSAERVAAGGGCLEQRNEPRHAFRLREKRLDESQTGRVIWKGDGPFGHRGEEFFWQHFFADQKILPRTDLGGREGGSYIEERSLRWRSRQGCGLFRFRFHVEIRDSIAAAPSR